MYETIKIIKIKANTQYTTYFWGKIEEISGKYLNVIEENKQGACLCVNEKGLIDVDKRDIEEKKGE